MLTTEENSLLTKTSAGTEMGTLLRRYWHPIAALSELDKSYTRRVRIMGEDLVLYKTRRGELGLIEEACPHRRASLAYGIPIENGIRCPYHGWAFDRSGRCIDQPNEPDGSIFKDKIATPGYPVQVLSGVVFAYLGPLPAPLMTRLDGFVVEPAIRLIGRAVIPCNWLQIQENSVDPVHSEWLHGHFAEFMAADQRVRYAYSGHHVKIAFDEMPYGIIKRRLKEGQSEDCSDWRVGHPLVFPNILAVGSDDATTWKTYEFQIRVPEDDTHTTHFWFTAFVPHAGVDVPPALIERPYFFEVPLEERFFETAESQDILAWTTQGPIVDRTAEHLGSTDRGVTMFRQMIRRELKTIEAGVDPMLVNRDPAKDVPLDLPVETGKAHVSDSFASVLRRRYWRYSGIADELLAVFAESARSKV